MCRRAAQFIRHGGTVWMPCSAKLVSSAPCTQAFSNSSEGGRQEGSKEEREEGGRKERGREGGRQAGMVFKNDA